MGLTSIRNGRDTVVARIRGHDTQSLLASHLERWEIRHAKIAFTSDNRSQVSDIGRRLALKFVGKKKSHLQSTVRTPESGKMFASSRPPLPYSTFLSRDITPGAILQAVHVRLSEHSGQVMILSVAFFSSTPPQFPAQIQHGRKDVIDTQPLRLVDDRLGNAVDQIGVERRGESDGRGEDGAVVEEPVQTLGLDQRGDTEGGVFHEVSLADFDAVDELIPRGGVAGPDGASLLANHVFEPGLVVLLRVVEWVVEVHPSGDVALDSVRPKVRLGEGRVLRYTHIWETFSSKVMRGSRSFTLSSTDAEASLYIGAEPSVFVWRASKGNTRADTSVPSARVERRRSMILRRL